MASIARAISYVILALTFAVPSVLFGQKAEWIDPLSPPHDLTIKGSEQPELIPLSLCYNVFFRMVAHEASNGDEGYRGARLLLLKTGINEASIDPLIEVARDYDRRVAAIDSEAEIHKLLYSTVRSPAAGAALLSLGERRNSEALNLLGAASDRVGYLEAQRVHRYIEEVVRRQVVIGGSDAALALNSQRCSSCNPNQQEGGRNQ